jgi:hypothetical protein
MKDTTRISKANANNYNGVGCLLAYPRFKPSDVMEFCAVTAGYSALSEMCFKRMQSVFTKERPNHKYGNMV